MSQCAGNECGIESRGRFRMVVAQPPSPVVKWLLIINGAAFIVVFVLPFATQQAIFNLLGFVPAQVLKHASWWQFFTALFLHGDPTHLLLNMMFLWFFGPPLERVWGSRTFLFYYFLCGLGGGLGDLLTRAAGPSSTIPGIGASGAIFGLMAAYGLIFGRQIILAFFVFPMQARYFVLICLVIELLWGMHGNVTGVGHFAHLGGAAAGGLYILWQRWSGHAKEGLSAAEPVVESGPTRTGSTGNSAVPDRFAMLELDDQEKK